LFRPFLSLRPAQLRKNGCDNGGVKTAPSRRCRRCRTRSTASPEHARAGAGDRLAVSEQASEELFESGLKTASCAWRANAGVHAARRAHRQARLLRRSACAGPLWSSSFAGGGVPTASPSWSAGATCTARCARWARSWWRSRRKRHARTTHAATARAAVPILSDAAQRWLNDLALRIPCRRSIAATTRDSGQHSVRQLRRNIRECERRELAAAAARGLRSAAGRDDCVSEGYATSACDPSRAM